MENFAIEIKSESDYNNVKSYAEKWGYSDGCDWDFKLSHAFVYVSLLTGEKTYNPCHSVRSEKIFKFSENWKKSIRENSRLKLDNVYVRIDTVELVKEAWGVIKDCGLKIYIDTKDYLSKCRTDYPNKYIHYDGGELIGTGSVYGKIEISPKQLAQLLGFKKKIQSYQQDLELISEINLSGLEKVNERIDRLAKNYGILESDKLATKSQLKEINDKLRKRIYEIEKKLDSEIKIQVDGNALKAVIDKPQHKLSIPKIAIRVNNRKEFDELMSIYEVLGWKWLSGHKSIDYIPSSLIGVYTFHDGINKNEDQSFIDLNYKIIPFSQIKGLK